MRASRLGRGGTGESSVSPAGAAAAGFAPAIDARRSLPVAESHGGDGACIFSNETEGDPMNTWKKPKASGLFVLAIILSLSGGCASTQETGTLEQSVSMLYERVQQVEKRVDANDGQSNKTADVYSRIQELQMKMGALNGRIEELDHKIDMLAKAAATPPPAPPQQRVEPRVEQPPQPSSGITMPPTPPQAAPPPVATPTPPPAQPKTAPPVKSAPPPQTPPPPAAKQDPEKALYDRGNQAFQQGQYEVARKDFESLVAKYPKSELADNALYSAGECYFSEKRYQNAIESFQQVLDRYPKGNRVPQALLKQGAAFQQLGDSTAARILYERVVDKYPGTPSAQAAEKKLKSLK